MIHKLETLRDIERYDEPIPHSVFEYTVNSDDLRELGIKWYNVLTDPSAPIRVILAFEYGLHDLESVRAWIKHFFNLTEEDLK